MIKYIYSFRTLFLVFCCSVIARGFSQDTTITIPLGGNTWSNKHGYAGGQITQDGIVLWSDAGTWFSTYFKMGRTGRVHLTISLSVPGDGESTISLSMGSVTRELNIKGSAIQIYDAGKWTVGDQGYETLVVKGVSKSGKYFAQIRDIQLRCPLMELPVACVPAKGMDLDAGRRAGPTVYLWYDSPVRDVEWFYNEVTVPEGDDSPGSWYAIDGFSAGYFGMQIYPGTERKILFSVWNPAKGEDPQSIPDSARVVLLKKGKDVQTSAFDHQGGTGGKSYLNYPWKGGNTYKFLLRAEQLDNNCTSYTGWFYTPEDGQWKLIASWKRPMTHSWLGGFNSFTQNLDPEYGNQEHYALYNQTWVCDTTSKWTPVTKGKFMGDNAAKNGYRIDYAGGLNKNSFYLRNGGFFANNIPLNTRFEASADAQSNPPDIDFSKLP